MAPVGKLSAAARRRGSKMWGRFPNLPNLAGSETCPTDPDPHRCRAVLGGIVRRLRLPPNTVGMGGAVEVPGLLPERPQLDAAGDGRARRVLDTLAVAVNDQRHVIRRGADRADPDDHVADVAFLVPDVDQVAGPQ